MSCVRACADVGIFSRPPHPSSLLPPSLSSPPSLLLRQTPRKYALAWSDFHLYGRVRPWDGLIVLVRAPVRTGPEPPLRDTYVFRGYLLGGTTLVGAWRHITDSVHTIPLEGTFVVSRLDEPPEPEPSEPASPQPCGAQEGTGAPA